MKIFYTIIVSTIICNSLFSQSLNVELETVDEAITWPWNWDIVSDGDRLITVNEIGTLNIRENGVWQNIEIDPNNDQLEPRSVDVDNEGNIWIATFEHGLWQYSVNNEFTNFNTSNSSLPTDNLRVLDIHNNFIWVSTSESEGLIRYDIATGESLLFNMDNNEQLKTNGTLDPYIDQDGNVWIDNRECLSIIDTDLNWTSQDFRSILSGAIIKDIDFPSPGITIISGNSGIVKSDNGVFEDVIKDNINNYNAYHEDNNGTEWIHYTRITESFLMVRNNGNVIEINSDSIEGIPSQVFKMIEHQDTIIMVGLLGNNIAKLTYNVTTSTDNEQGSDITIFPNPATEYLNIEGLKAKGNKYSILNLSGQLIESGTIKDNQLNLLGLKSGMYTLEIFDKNSSDRYIEKINVVR